MGSPKRSGWSSCLRGVIIKLSQTWLSSFYCYISMGRHKLHRTLLFLSKSCPRLERGIPYLFINKLKSTPWNTQDFWMSLLPMSRLFPGRQEPDVMVCIMLLSPEMLHLLCISLCAPWSKWQGWGLGKTICWRILCSNPVWATRIRLG